jgi:hypothetical protein
VNALEIEKQERVSGTLKVRLRNVSGKDITAWSYTTGWVAHPGGQVTDGNATGDPLIAAGDVTELEFDRTTLYHISLHTPQNIALINIIAVVFDDLTAEGDARVTTEMIEGSKGCLVQLKRIRPLLKKVLEAPDSDFSLAVREFEAAISALPDLASPSQSAAFREGLADGKRYVELNLELVRKEITTKPVSIGRETLKHVIGGIERSLAKHSSRLTPSLR